MDVEGFILTRVVPSLKIGGSIEELQKRRKELCERITKEGPSPHLTLELHLVVQRHAQLYQLQEHIEQEAEEEKEEEWLKREEESWNKLQQRK